MPRPLPLLLVLLLSSPALAHDWFGNKEYTRQLRLEETRRIDRMLDSTYGPNPRSTPPNLQPLANNLQNLFESIAEGRRQRAQERAVRDQYLIELFRLQRQRADEQARLDAEQARQAQFNRWESDWQDLKTKALAGDRSSSEWVARLTRYGSPRLPKLTQTGDKVALPWLQLASNQGSATAAFDYGILLREPDPRESLRQLTLAAERGHLDAVPHAAAMAAEGVPGLEPDPAEAARLYRIGIDRGHKPSLVSAGWSALADPRASSADREQAVRWLAQAGPDPVADSLLAQVYWHGRAGIAPDRRHAVLLAQRALAAKPASAGANEIIGLWLSASTLDHDRRQSLVHLRTAAESGSIPACRQLAYAYGNGADGAERSGSEALRWLRKATSLGDAECALVLARNLRNASPPDIQGAMAAYTEASRHGSADAALELALQLDTGRDGFPRRPAESHRLARIAADAGNRDAMELLAWQFLGGRGCTRDAGAAATRMRRAAESGSASAQHVYGLMCHDAIGRPKDLTEAREWTAKAAAQGHPTASAQLAFLLLTGTGGPSDAVQARVWAGRGAEAGSSQAQRMYGVLLVNGDGGAPDPAAGAGWLEKAHAQGDTLASLALGEFHRDGRLGTAPHPARAREYFRTAAKSEDREIAEDARKALARLERTAAPASLQGLKIGPTTKPAATNTGNPRLDSLRIR